MYALAWRLCSACTVKTLRRFCPSTGKEAVDPESWWNNYVSTNMVLVVYSNTIAITLNSLERFFAIFVE